MLFALSNRVPIEREGDIIGGHGHGGKEAKCILIVVVLGKALINRIECLGNLCRCGKIKVQSTRRAEDDVVAKPGDRNVMKRSHRN